ncbi:MAG: hypothetical protein GY723_01550 [bacterium]|nr:hypothetical protein [bacterium]
MNRRSTRNLVYILGVLLWGGMPPAAERDGMEQFLWDRDTEIRGMVTVSYAHASDSDGPSTRGLRLGYGYFGGKTNDYPWGEFWAAFREDGDYEITAAGLSVVPIAKVSRRFGVGPLFDLGLSRREQDGRSAYAGLVGAGAEGVVRVGRRWDLVTTAEAAYRTTGDVELQARVGIRFHHEKIPFFPRRR